MLSRGYQGCYTQYWACWEVMENALRRAEILIIILYVYLRFLPTLQCCDSNWGHQCSSEIAIFLLHHRYLTNKGNFNHGHWKHRWIFLHKQSPIATMQAQVIDSSLFLNAPFLSFMSPCLLEKCFFAHLLPCVLQVSENHGENIPYHKATGICILFQRCLHLRRG